MNFCLLANIHRILFAGTNTYLCMCWLRAIGGGWTTPTRMHEASILPCLFGCSDAKDEYRHYITCPMLRQLAKEALNMRESNCEVGHRLCLTACNLNRLKLLGYCHLLYHSLRKESGCFDSNGDLRPSRPSKIVQQRASDLVRALVSLIE